MKEATVMKFKNETHGFIYKTFIATNPYKLPAPFLAASYLLSAEKELWKRSKKAFHRKQIFFDEIPRTGLSPYAFALLHLAQDIYTGSHYVTLRDVADPYLISDKTFELVTEAIGLCREGYSRLGIGKQFN